MKLFNLTLIFLTALSMTSTPADAVGAPECEELEMNQENGAPKTVSEWIKELGKNGRTRLAKEFKDRLGGEKSSAKRRNFPFVFGRLKSSDAKMDIRGAAAQMAVFECGFFLGQISSAEQPVGFILQGMNALEVIPSQSRKIENTYYLGVLRFLPLSKENAALIKGKVKLQDPKTKFTVSFSPSSKTNTPTGGTDPREFWSEDYQVIGDSMSAFQSIGLTPARYYLTVSAPEHAEVYREINLSPGATVDLGEIELPKKRSIEIHYQTFREFGKNGSKPFDAILYPNEAWSANGIDRRKFKDSQVFEPYHYTFKVIQEGQRVMLQSSYGPDEIATLGKEKIETYAHLPLDQIRFAPVIYRFELREGFTYLYHSEVFHYWLLFQVHYLN